MERRWLLRTVSPRHFADKMALALININLVFRLKGGVGISLYYIFMATNKRYEKLIMLDVNCNSRLVLQLKNFFKFNKRATKKGER